MFDENTISAVHLASGIVGLDHHGLALTDHDVQHLGQVLSQHAGHLHPGVISGCEHIDVMVRQKKAVVIELDNVRRKVEG